MVLKTFPSCGALRLACSIKKPRPNAVSGKRLNGRLWTVIICSISLRRRYLSSIESSIFSCAYPALKHEQDSRLFDINQPLTLIAAADAFYLNATNKLRELNSTAYSFRHMTDEERDILCWNQLVKVWQIIGRLVRGNVPAEVYFLDAKFAPFSAEGLTDKASNSLLVGMIEALEAHVEGEGLEPYQLSLARSLYSDFLTALKNTDGLKF